MNKSLFILLSTLTMCANSAQKDELKYNVDKLPLSMFAAHALKENKYMPGNGLKGGGPVAGAWGYSATKGACYGAVAAAATYAVVQSGGTLAPVAKVVIAKAAEVTVGAGAGEVIVAAAGVGAKTGFAAKVMASIGTGAAALGGYLPATIEGVSGVVGAALTACPFLP